MKHQIQGNPFNLGHYPVPEDARGGYCLDIGGNLGDFTFKYKDFFSRIVCVEPQLKLYENLVERLEPYNHISVINAAVWSESGLELQLISHQNQDHGSVAVDIATGSPDWLSDHPVNKCKSIALEDFEHPIDYLKIDCETSEYQFLMNKNLSTIKYIGMEIHFQMGEEKYYDLIKWIRKTHDLYGHYWWDSAMNKEIFFVKKAI